MAVSPEAAPQAWRPSRSGRWILAVPAGAVSTLAAPAGASPYTYMSATPCTGHSNDEKRTAGGVPFGMNPVLTSERPWAELVRTTEPPSRLTVTCPEGSAASEQPAATMAAARR